MNENNSYTPYFKGNATAPSANAWKKLPKRKDFAKASGYISQPGLIDAVNVALALGQPLLLTGEPGTGKSSLAKNIAYELGCDELDLKVEIKSTTTAKDLFYTFDHIGWFNQRSMKGKTPDPTHFIAFTGLGKALIQAADDVPAALKLAGLQGLKKQRTVVLIDEIDKAPRDVPNDLLNEIEHMYFKVPEIGNAEVKANPALRPIVIITSNSEKVLPDAFLRRCIFFNIEFPDEATLLQILISRFKGETHSDSALFEDAISLLIRLRKTPELDKKPGLSELIEFVEVVRHNLKPNTRLITQPELIKAKMSALIKSRLEEKRKEAIVSDWINA